MLRYVGKRILSTILILLAVIFVVYGVIMLAPGDPATIMLGTKATPEAVAELNAKLGFDRPFLVQYGDYVKNLILHHNMGISYSYGTGVWDEITLRFPHTFLLAFLTMIVQTILAVVIGSRCARKPGSWFDRIFSALSGITTAIPSYVSGLVLMLFFSVTLKITPLYGVKTMRGYILPVTAMTLASVGYLIKTVRSVMLDVLGQDYIRTARAIGESKQKILYSYAFRNAAVQVVTTIGYQFAGLIGGTVIVESIFSINGVGSMMISAVNGRDIPMMLGITVVLTAVFCLVQLLMELSWWILDPRVRAKYEQGR